MVSLPVLPDFRNKYINSPIIHDIKKRFMKFILYKHMPDELSFEVPLKVKFVLYKHMPNELSFDVPPKIKFVT